MGWKGRIAALGAALWLAGLTLAGVTAAGAATGGGAGDMQAVIDRWHDRLSGEFGLAEGGLWLYASVARQELWVLRGRRSSATYPVSTSKVGIGNRAGSNRTPLGVHRVDSRFGDGAPVGMSFVARRATGRIVDILTRPVDIPEDHITTRVLWLDGLEPGVNRGPGIDSKSRYIYIHGTAEEGLIGQPASHGCIRMRNQDVISLFDAVPTGTLVVIGEQ